MSPHLIFSGLHYQGSLQLRALSHLLPILLCADDIPTFRDFRFDLTTFPRLADGVQTLQVPHQASVMLGSGRSSNGL